MDTYFDYTEIVSNGFITTIDYQQLPINQRLIKLGYLNCYMIGTQLTAINIDNFIKFITINSLSEAEVEDLETDFEQGVIYLFTKLISIAEKLDQFIKLIATSQHLDSILIQNQSCLKLITPEDIEHLLATPEDVVYEGERLGQLEWLDHAKFMTTTNNFYAAINSYNKYYLETTAAEAGFNLGVLLSKIGLDHLAIKYYLQLFATDVDCLHNLAYSYLQTNQLHLAYETISKVNFDKSVKSFLIKAQIEIKLGQYNAALNTLNNGFVATKVDYPVEAQLIKRQFISLNQYIKKIAP